MQLFGAAGEIAKLVSPDAVKTAGIKVYRNMCSALRAALDVPEVKACANRFAEIDFARVTSLCMNRQRKAFLNEKKATKVLDAEFEETGDRHPDSEDRVASRKNLLKCLVEQGTIKGKDLFPHELVQQVMHSQVSTAEGAILNAQHQAIRENVVKMAEERMLALEEASDVPKEKATPGMDLSKIVVMSDVSGSMSGTPMEVRARAKRAYARAKPE